MAGVSRTAQRRRAAQLRERGRPRRRGHSRRSAELDARRVLAMARPSRSHTSIWTSSTCPGLDIAQHALLGDPAARSRRRVPSLERCALDASRELIARRSRPVRRRRRLTAPGRIGRCSSAARSVDGRPPPRSVGDDRSQGRRAIDEARRTTDAARYRADGPVRARHSDQPRACWRTDDRIVRARLRADIPTVRRRPMAVRCATARSEREAARSGDDRQAAESRLCEIGGSCELALAARRLRTADGIRAAA